MPPKQQGTLEDGNFKPGIVTCSAAEYLDESRLAFVVQARLALVLDRKDLDDGQIIGMVVEGDIVCASMVELPWVMLKSGSAVRHPKMREGRIKIQREGWLLTSHPEYGDLLAAYPADKVRRYYEEDLWLKLPIVKTKAKAKAKSGAVAQPQEEPLLQSRREADEAARLADLARQEEEQRREMDRALEEARRAKERQRTAREEEEGRQIEGKATMQRDREKAMGAAQEARRKREEESQKAEAAAKEAQELFMSSIRISAPAEASAPAKAKSGGPKEADGESLVSKAKSVAAQFLPAARDVDPAVAAAKAAAAKARLKRALALEAKAAPVAPEAHSQKGVMERAKAPPETLESHLRTCEGEHWKVVHDFVFLRSKASVASDQITVLRKGAVFWLGSPPGTPMQETRSQDGKWVKCTKEAKVWLKIESSEPEFLLLNHVYTAGFVMIRNEEHGDLIRLVPNTKIELNLPLPGKDAPKPPEAAKDNGKPAVEPEPKAEPVTQEAVSKMHHWVIESRDAKAYSQRDEASTVEMNFQEGDVVVVGGASWTRTWSDISGKTWLLLPPGGQVYRKLQPILPQGGNKRSSYILVRDEETELAREYTPPETGVAVRFVSAYGEPWVVEHDQVVVRRGPSTTDVPVGIMLKGDVIGVRRTQGDWVQLMQDSDVRFRKKGTTGAEASSTFLSMVNSVRELKVEEPVLKQRREQGIDPLPVPIEPRGEPPMEAWMLVEHPSLGHLLRRARKRKGGLSKDVVICKSRLNLYREVVEICHRRIYEENLEGLWDGERDKLPTTESIEAKLFDSTTSVVHLSKAGKFCGGAIVKQVAVKSKQVEGSSNLNLTGHAAAGGEVEERAGRTMVGYIDSCAAEPRTGGGRMIWETISSMPFVCLTCHSILLQKTVDFWQACGMRRLDPTSKLDCEEFKRSILVQTMGKVILELADVEKELPSSKLPLFVWVPSRFSQVSVDPNSAFIFTPDEGEGYI